MSPEYLEFWSPKVTWQLIADDWSLGEKKLMFWQYFSIPLDRVGVVPRAEDGVSRENCGLYTFKSLPEHRLGEFVIFLKHKKGKLTLSLDVSFLTKWTLPCEGVRDVAVRVII